jgi:hypothetical protein
MPQPDLHLSLIEFAAVARALRFTRRKPPLCNIPHALQLALHLRVLGCHRFGVRVARNINRRRKQNHCSRKGHRQQKMVPRLFKRFPTLHSNMKHHDGASCFSRQHHWPRLGHVPRSPRPIDRERAIHSLFQPPRHHRQSPQSAARRTSLRRTESQPLDHFARPLPIECRRVHHHHAVIPVPPHNRNNNPVPERPDTLLLRRIHPLRMLPPKDFISQRRPERSNHPVHRSGDDGNLDSPRPWQIRQPRVVVRVYGSLLRFLRGLKGCVWRRHYLCRRLRITRRIV